MGTHGGFILLLLAYCLRLLLVFSPGYIHPDEFFQGGQVRGCQRPFLSVRNSPKATLGVTDLCPYGIIQEVFAYSLLDIKECFVPWEFWPEHALRSVAFP